MAENIHGAFQFIISELRNLSDSDIEQQFTSTLPGLISAGPDQSILVNEAIDQCIVTIAAWLRSQRPAVKSKYEIKEWNAVVRRSFGPALMIIDLDDPIEDSGRALKKIIEDAVDAYPQIIPIQHTTIGCTLFHDPLPSPVNIGPVRFESKETWLARARDSGQLDAGNHGRLEHAFSGHPLQVAEDKMQNIFERSIIAVLQSSQMACTVTTNHLAPGMTGARAIMGARLAQMSIALLWRLPSEILKGFHLSVDHGHRQIRMIPFIPGQTTLGGFRMVGYPSGPTLDPKEWSELCLKKKDYFDVAGRMISYWTNGDLEHKKVGLVSNMAAALWLMWEGCREENDLMSIVKFTGALEFLSQGAGGKSGGIMTLAEKRLNMKPNDKISGEKTLKQIVDQIYSEGRSRTLHGTNPFVDHDWSVTRLTTESLTRHCLIACMRWLEKNPTATDPKEIVS